MIIRQATEDDVVSALSRLRGADHLELIRSGFADHEATMRRHVVDSDCAVAFVDDGGTLLAVSGVLRPTLLLDDVATPWMLGTRELRHHRMAFLRETRRWIQEWARTYRMLIAWSDADYVETTKWLRWLGFKLVATEPVGCRGELFHRFEMRQA